jgi:hypothetical protein
MLDPNPVTRYTLKEVLAHDWFKGDYPNQEEVAEATESYRE